MEKQTAINKKFLEYLVNKETKHEQNNKNKFE